MKILLVIAAILVIFGLPTLLKIIGTWLVLAILTPIAIVGLIALVIFMMN